jgi:outer membrane protein/adhesin transport system outer membrane protein
MQIAPARRCLGAALIACALALAAAPAAAQSLNDALAGAYQTNPVLQAARAQLRSTDELVPEALSGWRPTVTAEAEGGGGIDDRHDDGRALGLAEFRVVQPLYNGGRTSATVDQAENLVQAQRAQLVAAEQQVLLQSIAAYMDVVRAGPCSPSTRTTRRWCALSAIRPPPPRRRRRLRHRRVAGRDAPRPGASAAHPGRGRHEVRARRLSPADRRRPATLTPPPLPTGLPAGEDEAVAAAGHPTVVAAEFAERAARDGVEVVLGELRPQVSVEGELLTSKETARILAKVTIPLYQAGDVDARARSSKETYGERRFDTETQQRQTAAEAAAAWYALDAAGAQIGSFDTQIETAKKALAGTRRDHDAGTRTLLDVLDAQQELLGAQTNLVGARHDQVVAAYRVLAATGRLTARDLNLPVTPYDFEAHYLEVRDKFWGTGPALD